MDGLGGLPHPASGLTELETARTPHLDALVARGSLGMIVMVKDGITPGSGPGHLALFGYDPIRTVIGRGALSALGVGLELQPGDVAARLNLATFDAAGLVTDRRAGRPSDRDAALVVARVQEQIRAPKGIQVTFVPEKEHRVVLHLRGQGLGLAALSDTDPLETGRHALPVKAEDERSQATADVVADVLEQTRRILADEPRMNGFLARGFAAFERIATMDERFGLRGLALAKYPMYRGVARLVGMQIPGVPTSNEDTVALLERSWGEPDLYFLHFKDTDTRGHDGDFAGKVAAIEEVDALIPRVSALRPDVIIVTGDHSTPAVYKEHSWHHVPALLWSQWARPTAYEFGESTCRSGDLGLIHATDLMPLALAHAGRLVKYGA
ncbi:MAG: 2,3-bisphosphoglycerate-independent phosphoglycerate mutase [Gemmatimonadetes bacterium]|nr:2,3-bisphosphoglycerate-independent phosphoglycerate mutase [Gemmatimonadota bacterium]